MHILASSSPASMRRLTSFSAWKPFSYVKSMPSAENRTSLGPGAGAGACCAPQSRILRRSSSERRRVRMLWGRASGEIPTPA